MSERDSLSCPVGDCPVERIFTPDTINHARIDSMGEDVNTPARRADGTASWNMGLPGVDGEGHGHRALTNREVGSNANAREIAKRAGLTPVDEGRYRTVPR